jgi:hypothetical protein
MNNILDSNEPFIEESVEISLFKEDIIKEITTNGVMHLACFQVPVSTKEFKFSAAANWSNKNYAALILYPPGNLLMGDDYTVQFLNSMTPLTQIIWSYKTPEDAINKVNKILFNAEDAALCFDTLETDDMDYAVIDGDYQMI